jgi:hypothetical protein
MSSKNVTVAHWAAIAAVLLGAVMFAQLATASDNSAAYAMSQVVAQVPTPTPFRFLTPTPIVPRSTTSTTTTAPATSTSTPPRTGGFPLELALPALAGGLTAIGGGSFLLRRKPAR